MLPASMATMAFFLVAVNSPGKSTEATTDESSRCTVTTGNSAEASPYKGATRSPAECPC